MEISKLGSLLSKLQGESLSHLWVRLPESPEETPGASAESDRTEKDDAGLEPIEGLEVQEAFF